MLYNWATGMIIVYNNMIIYIYICIYKLLPTKCSPGYDTAVGERGMKLSGGESGSPGDEETMGRSSGNLT